ncbi:hypothetical protein NQ314_011210 [Rhamnusium bicolor]|uniref:Uncharacterized protein n=1 Tax=Rhamnusium bicolor TaxID=1586634 RepID=A0AAV8XK47_9CUCU|nr:hypothetical protein NQ314_011210 [Rhamnusium bicolor]
MKEEKIKKPKSLRKLPTEPEVSSPNSERDVVGDDLNKKNEVHILCECEPNVAGAAVPTVISFVNSPSEINNVMNSSSSNMTRNDSNQNAQKLTAAPRNKNCVIGKKIVIKESKNFKNNLRLTHKNKEGEKKTKHLENTTDGKDDINNSKEIKSPQESNLSLKSVTERGSTEMKVNLKRPSLIPKLSSTISRKGRPLSRDNAEKRENNRTKEAGTSKNLSKTACTSNNTNELKTYKDSKIATVKSGKQSKTNGTIGSTISFRMLGLQERLKATTTMLRQKIDMDRSSSKLLPQYSDNSNLLAAPLVDKDLSVRSKKTIADKLCDYETDQTKSDNADNQSDGSLEVDNEKPQKTSTSTKDNKIYIKFMPTRDKKQDGKKKRKEGLPEQTEEVQTDLSLGVKLTSESLNSDTCLTEVKEENKIKDSDSMDGVFIPTCEPPMNMEEEEETTGLDITITFPEFNQLQSNGTDSHISVCLSEISAEALGKLKRCPKEFTLRMDFVEGKVLFHSGKGPTNNFSIGPDLKFIESYIDDKQSDIINIKPSTECSFGSQLIPVENTKEANSSKTLKSTDSELFNVVNLPLLYKSPYLNTASGHKSCITFKNDKFISMEFLARQLFKSMPQIPSLTNIFEEEIVDSFNKTG